MQKVTQKKLTLGYLAFVFIFCSLFSGVVSAKQLSLKKVSVAPYVRGDIGTSAVNQNAFGDSSGDATITQKVRYQWGGELGLLVTGQKVGVRAGVLFLAPQKMDAIPGKDSGGTEMFNLTSNILGVFPVGHFEFSPRVTDWTRIHFSLGGGAGTVTFLNEYKMTDAGTAATGLLSYTEEGSAIATLFEASVGFEFLLSDNVTNVFYTGYRQVVTGDFKHKRNAETVQGTVGKGDPVMNDDGSKRKLNLSSAFFGYGLRVYIDL